MFCYIDIETGRAQRSDIVDHVRDKVKPRANLKDPDKIKADIEDKTAAALSATALNGLWGNVLCVGLAFDGQDPFVVSDQDERSTLLAVMGQLADAWEAEHHRPPIFVGFNILSFDLPFLWQRCLIHGIKPPINLRQNEKPWSDKVVDLRQVLACGDLRAEGTLKDWCLTLGLPIGEEDIDGAEVPEAWEDGRRVEVIEHCRQDIVRLQRIHECVRQVGG